jgi:chromate transporter
VAALGVFLPCYLFVILPAPYFRRIAGNRTIKAFVDGVTAGATGAIVGAVVVLGHGAIVDITTAVIALATLGVLLGLRRVPEPVIILAAGVAGLCLS